MAKRNLGIRRIHSIEICVREAGVWMEYFARGFGFQHVASTSGAAAERCGTRRHLLRCGSVGVVLAEAVHAGSAVRRFLERHPEGIGRVYFLVESVKAVEERLVERHGAIIDEAAYEMGEGGRWAELRLATPIGDVEYCFVETSDEAGVMMPGMCAVAGFEAASNPLGLTGIDHLTTNARTMMPIAAFYEHVLGFRRCWDVRFHSEEIRPGIGAGLKSVVMWDEESGIKIANNEPLRPRFEMSQVELSYETNRGPGLQQVALGVKNIFHAVRQARERGIVFLSTPDAYYSRLPRRMDALGIRGGIAVEEMQAMGVLADGDSSGYLLQTFCADQSVQFGRPGCGPLFVELVERHGAEGFGEGNFRALFEALQG